MNGMRRLLCTPCRSIVGAVLLSLLIPVAALADAEGEYHGPGMMWDGSWTGWLLMGPVTMLLFFGAIAALIVVLVCWLGGQGSGGGSRSPDAEKTALDILRERFARGEIDKNEFEERKRLRES